MYGVVGEKWKGRGNGGRLGGEEAKLCRPIQLGGHALRAVEGGWVCVVCWRFTGSWNRTVAERCTGSAAGFWARRAAELGGRGGTDGAGHVRAAYGDMVWCVRCGSYAIRWAVGLAEPCRGAPANPSQQRVLGRLKAERHPRTNAPLGGMLRMEVHGMKLCEDDLGTREVGGGGMATRPGGRMPVQGGRTQEVEEALENAYMGTVGGPKREYMMRKRNGQAELVHCREDGEEERASKRMRASEAWGQELQVEEH